MNEREFRSSADPLSVLAWLENHGRISNRQRRLWACGCVRQVWRLLVDERSRRAVELSERLADGQVSAAEAAEAYQAYRAATDAVTEAGGDVARLAARAAAYAAASPADDWLLDVTWQPAAQALEGERLQAHGPLPECFEVPEEILCEDSSLAHQALDPRAVTQLCDVLRNIVGNPFRPVTVAHTYDGAIVELARVVYEEQTFDRLPALAAMLDSQGGTDAELLGHLRGPGPFVRGDWVLDMILQKQ